ncbi:hypothetical protein C0Q92_23500 [Streptomyces albidoflavus]|uniref:Uncharacterized protein n=1 Tax=Streptomyces albidoflavus TaxID=1886 RepID=A0A8G1ZPC0_9ACTN|nr:hypothetical protein B9S66_07270 [Streptomyces sp. SM17]RZE16912.1 hypothetical protein C0Q93_23115 [Streptomyces albidoflavus]RZE19039.1 hypothetical protein C0Q92_23500 [Streptomyces albidoflavus]RZE35410.1 hypothetical protein C0Q94_23130 [Streptomyces albidoflavus]RZE35710.1 hypothetical protein C0Q91_23760 [Streptomyces albidoflavus]
MRGRYARGTGGAKGRRGGVRGREVRLGERQTIPCGRGFGGQGRGGVQAALGGGRGGALGEMAGEGWRELEGVLTRRVLEGREARRTRAEQVRACPVLGLARADSGSSRGADRTGRPA